jgi:hypothetical protein
MAFGLCCFASRDNPDFGSCRTNLRPKVNDGKQRTIARTSDREPALFTFAMFQVGDCKQERVVENSAGEAERDAVFAYVRNRFDLVPLELKLARMQDLIVAPHFRGGQFATAVMANMAIAATKNL